MALTLEDLQPKSFVIKIKDIELKCKPLRLSHTLILAKVGDVFQNISNATAETIEQAEKDIDKVFSDLIPELKGMQLDMQATVDVITQMMEQIQPSDNAELNRKGVKFDDDPKDQRNG